MSSAAHALLTLAYNIPYISALHHAYSCALFAVHKYKNNGIRVCLSLLGFRRFGTRELHLLAGSFQIGCSSQYQECTSIYGRSIGCIRIECSTYARLGHITHIHLQSPNTTTPPTILFACPPFSHAYFVFE